MIQIHTAPDTSSITTMDDVPASGFICLLMEVLKK